MFVLRLRLCSLIFCSPNFFHTSAPGARSKCLVKSKEPNRSIPLACVVLFSVSCSIVKVWSCTLRPGLIRFLLLSCGVLLEVLFYRCLYSSMLYFLNVIKTLSPTYPPQYFTTRCTHRSDLPLQVTHTGLLIYRIRFNRITWH